MNTRATAAKILYKIATQKQSLDRVLSESICNIPSKDGALIQELCYGTLRYYQRLDFVLEILLQKDTKKLDTLIHALLLIGLYQIIFLRVPDYAAITETVSAARILKKPWATALINAVLHEFIRNKQKLLEKIETSEVAKYSHPEWLINKLKQAYPNNWQEILLSNISHPPMHLRVNLRNTTIAAYLQKLTAANIVAKTYAFSKIAITLEKPLDVAKLPGFNKGLVSVQDLAAQFAAPLLELAPNLRVLDACAAPGGKTAHIVECVEKLQEVVALDIDAERLVKINSNLKRLALSAKLICGDAANPSSWWDKKPFDRILLDAPCSATGVIRRHPDIKILRKDSDIEKFHNQDLTLLDALWPLLKPDGILLYATCSLLPEENSEVIAKFLTFHPDAKEIKFNLPYGTKAQYGWQIFPEDQGPDGFYYAKLHKINVL